MIEGIQLLTLSDNGGVTRGICQMNEQNDLTEIIETRGIVKVADEAEANGIRLNADSLVSMNMWGLTPDVLDMLQTGFEEFFEREVPENPLGAEYLIPVFIEQRITEKKVKRKSAVYKRLMVWYDLSRGCSSCSRKFSADATGRKVSTGFIF